MEHSAILSTCIKLPPVFKTFVLSFLSNRLRQVSLYAQFVLQVSLTQSGWDPVSSTVTLHYDGFKDSKLRQNGRHVLVLIDLLIYHYGPNFVVGLIQLMLGSHGQCFVLKI